MKLCGVRCLVLAAGLCACGSLQAMPPMVFPKAVPAAAPAEAPPAEQEQAQAQEPEQAQESEQAQEQTQEQLPTPTPAPAPSLDLKLHAAPPTQFVAPAPETTPSDSAAPPAAAASDAVVATDAPAPDAGPAPEAAATPTEAPIPQKVVFERCGVVYEPARGSVSTMYLRSIRIGELAPDAIFELPAEAPANVKAVQCGRDSIVPLPNDYKVLAAGFPLSIIVRDGRAAVLESPDGSKLGLRTLEGKLSVEEDARIKAYLEDTQPAFDIAPRTGKR